MYSFGRQTLLLSSSLTVLTVLPSYLVFPSYVVGCFRLLQSLECRRQLSVCRVLGALVVCCHEMTMLTRLCGVLGGEEVWKTWPGAVSAHAVIL